MIKKRLRDQEVFQSHELSLIATLIARGFPLLAVDKSNPKKAIFKFSNSTELSQAVKEYWDDTATVSPKKYFYALREAKSRLYQGGEE